MMKTLIVTGGTGGLGTAVLERAVRYSIERSRTSRARSSSA